MLTLLFFASFLGKASAAHSVVLSWTASTTTQGSSCSSCQGGVWGAIGYYVWRQAGSGGSWTLLTSTPVATNCSGASCTYTDTTVTGGASYGYEIAAVDSTNEMESTSILSSPDPLAVYNARTDFNTVALPSPLPNVGNLTGQNNYIYEPNFGTMILRATDANTLSALTNHSFITTVSGSGDTSIWSLPQTSGTYTGDYFIILGTDGANTFLEAFNPTTLHIDATSTYQVGSKQGTGSTVTPNEFYIHSFSLSPFDEIDSITVSSFATAPSPTKLFNFQTDSSNCVPATGNGGSTAAASWMEDTTVATGDTAFGSAISTQDIAAPTAPTVVNGSCTSGFQVCYTSGGSLAQTTYYVKVVYVNGGFSSPSSEVSITVPASNLLMVTEPPIVGNEIAWEVGASTTSGAEKIQGGLILRTISSWTESTSGLSNNGTLNTSDTSGGQNTARYAVVYLPGSGCSYYDTFGGTVGGDWGSSGTVTISSGSDQYGDRFNIHNARLSLNGQWLVLTEGACDTNITNCGGSSVPRVWFWQAGTTNVEACDPQQSQICSGHWAVGYQDWTNNGDTTMGAFEIRPMSSPGSWSELQSSYPSGIPTSLDQHQSWVDDNSGDTIPACDTTHVPSNTFVSAWENEVLCYATNGSGTVWRMGHTFTNPNDTTDFDGQWAIAGLSQDGNFMAVTSNWQDTLGSKSGGSSCTANSNCRSDVFIYALLTAQQPANPQAPYNLQAVPHFLGSSSRPGNTPLLWLLKFFRLGRPRVGTK